MTERIIVTVLAVLIAAVLLIVMVQPGIDLMRRFIGRDRCYGGEALDGRNTWFVGTLLVGIVAWFEAPRSGYATLAAIPIIPIALTMMWVAYYTLKATIDRKRQFAITGGQIIDARTGNPIDPQYMVEGGWSDMTGPATGYYREVIQLGRDGRPLATNIYIDDRSANRDAAAVRAAAPACRSLSIVVVAKTDDGRWETVTLVQRVWTPLLCGSLEALTKTDRAWWRQWCQPEFGPTGRQTVDSAEIAAHIDRLLEAYPRPVDQKQPPDATAQGEPAAIRFMDGTSTIEDGVQALRTLVARHPQLDITTHAAHNEVIDKLQTRQGAVIAGFSGDGIRVQEYRQWKR